MLPPSTAYSLHKSKVIVYHFMDDLATVNLYACSESTIACASVLKSQGQSLLVSPAVPGGFRGTPFCVWSYFHPWFARLTASSNEHVAVTTVFGLNHIPVSLRKAPAMPRELCVPPFAGIVAS